MKRIFLVTTTIVWLCGCNDNSPANSASKDTITPQNATAPTPTNPGGLQPVNGDNMGTSDTTIKGINNRSGDSMRR